MQQIRVVYLDEAVDFIKSLPAKVGKKIAYNIDKVSGGIVDNELFKKLDGSNIWEFRTNYEGVQYRLLAFWDTEAGAIVVATHGFFEEKLGRSKERN